MWDVYGSLDRWKLSKADTSQRVGRGREYVRFALVRPKKKPVGDKVDKARSTLRCNKLGTSEKHVVWDYLTAEPSTAGAVTQPVPAALILALRAYLTHFRPKPTRDLDPNQGFKHIFLCQKIPGQQKRVE